MPFETNLERYERAIKTYDVEAYRQSKQIGATVYIPTVGEDSDKHVKITNTWIKSIITHKASFVAVTKHGTYRWADLCRWGREHKEKYGY